MTGPAGPVRVVLEIGEDYPHLFADADPEHVAWAETPASTAMLRPPVVVEVPAADWAAFQQAEAAYRQWVDRMEALRRQAGGRPC